MGYLERGLSKISFKFNFISHGQFYEKQKGLGTTIADKIFGTK